MTICEYKSEEYQGFSISTDILRLDMAFVHQFLSEESYWAGGTEKKDTMATFDNSLCYGLFENKKQIGFASVTTDYSSFAYISDVFIDEKSRGKGLSLWLMKCILSHPKLQYLDNWMLLTDDAHELYEKMGFKRVEGSTDQMIKYNSRFK